MNTFKASESTIQSPGAASRVRRAALMTLLASLVVAPNGSIAPARATSETHALFDLGAQAGAPFPSDLLTVADERQNTGRRVNLPQPDCASRPSECQDLDLINKLDGFNIQPRLSVPFDGPVDLSSVTSQTVFVIRLGDTMDPLDRGGRVVGINQIVWDTFTNTLHAQSDELLDQHTRYALIVTSGVRDQSGAAVQASEEFGRFRHDLNFGRTHDPELTAYRQALLDAMQAARAAGISEGTVVSASVFTTQSTTAVLEKIRDQIKAAPPSVARFDVAAGRTRTVFSLDAISGITFNRHTQVSPAAFTPVQLNIPLLRLIPGAIGQVAFGKYVSPHYQVHPGEYVPPVATRDGVPIVQGMEDVYFNLFIPSGAAPPNGWPVAIFGTGSAPDKNEQPLEVAAVMAARGIATISINDMGDGFGPLGTLLVNLTDGTQVSLPAGGRGVDQDYDNFIGTGEGRQAAPPRLLLSSHDGAIQTVADLMKLVRTIQAGVDVDGDGQADLNATRIYYFGHSLGAMWGTILLAIEPDIRVAVFNSVGTPYDNLRLSANFRAGDIGTRLASRTPSLINSPGLTQIDGVAVGPPYFNENLPLRNRPPVINDVAGATEIQTYLDRMKWATQSASSLALAPYLRKRQLASVPAKTVLIQFSKGDRVATNPTTTALLRAGDLADRTTYYRNELAVAENPLVPKDPHPLIRWITVPSVTAMSRGVQEQIAVFFASDGALVIHPEPARFFEVPVAGALPETLNFIP
jgi:pimeloyl-ACP methyl ester carboxylesterase